MTSDIKNTTKMHRKKTFMLEKGPPYKAYTVLSKHTWIEGNYKDLTFYQILLVKSNAIKHNIVSDSVPVTGGVKLYFIYRIFF